MKHKEFSSNLQFSIDDLSRVSIKKAAPLIWILKTTRSFEMSTLRVLEVNDNKVVNGSGGSIKKWDNSKNFKNPKFKTLEVQKNSTF